MGREMRSLAGRPAGFYKARGPARRPACALRLSVRTPPFHGGERGSIPLGRATSVQIREHRDGWCGLENRAYGSPPGEWEAVPCRRRSRAVFRLSLVGSGIRDRSGIRDPVPAAGVGGLHPRLVFLLHRDGLLLAERLRRGVAPALGVEASPRIVAAVDEQPAEVVALGGNLLRGPTPISGPTASRAPSTTSSRCRTASPALSPAPSPRKMELAEIERAAAQADRQSERLRLLPARPRASAPRRQGIRRGGLAGVRQGDRARRRVRRLTRWRRGAISGATSMISARRPRRCSGSADRAA
jgi:hypothetical protein